MWMVLSIVPSSPRYTVLLNETTLPVRFLFLAILPFLFCLIFVILLTFFFLFQNSFTTKVSKGANTNKCHNETPLITAVILGSLPPVRLLVEEGKADVDKKAPILGLSPLTDWAT